MFIMGSIHEKNAKKSRDTTTFKQIYVMKSRHGWSVIISLKNQIALRRLNRKFDDEKSG